MDCQSKIYCSHHVLFIKQLQIIFVRYYLTERAGFYSGKPEQKERKE